jgi:hypothetical protein
MKKTITEYYTASHSTPLVLVQNMGLIYIKGETRGYHVVSRFFEQIVLVLDDAIQKGGDFEVIIMPFPFDAMLLPIKNAGGFCVSAITVWEMGWTKWWESFIKIQRRLHYVLWSRHGPSLKLIKAFQETDRAETIPSEIISKIVHAYFEPPPRSMCTQNDLRVPIRIVETNSFKIQQLHQSA